jgi:hypothetical protein
MCNEYPAFFVNASHSQKTCCRWCVAAAGPGRPRADFRLRKSARRNLRGKLRCRPPGWPAKLLRNFAGLVLRHNLNPWARKGLQWKARRICMGKSEDLERKARFFAALAAKNVPKITAFYYSLRFFCSGGILFSWNRKSA